MPAVVVDSDDEIVDLGSSDDERGGIDLEGGSEEEGDEEGMMVGREGEEPDELDDSGYESEENEG